METKLKAKETPDIVLVKTPTTSSLGSHDDLLRALTSLFCGQKTSALTINAKLVDLKD